MDARTALSSTSSAVTCSQARGRMFQQMRRLATRRSAGISTRKDWSKSIQHQGAGWAAASLHRHPAVSKPRQPLHWHGLRQLQALRPYHLRF